MTPEEADSLTHTRPAWRVFGFIREFSDVD